MADSIPDELAHRHEADRILVVIGDNLGDLARKGEVIDRYYNPGELFRDVHLLCVGDSDEVPGDVQRLVGDAYLEVHRLPLRRRVLVESAGWRPSLLRHWSRPAVELAQRLRPGLIRCHGSQLNLLAAAHARDAVDAPLVVSLHNNPDTDVRGSANRRERLIGHALRAVERRGLHRADLVLPVYESIVPYLERIGVTRYEVAYNVVNPTSISPKTDYALHDPIRVVCVGRQYEGKDPTTLLEAVLDLPNVELTLVGDGPFHERLRERARVADASDRVHFVRSLPNDELCAQLPGFDLFATHNDLWGISKAAIEALLTGLPMITNAREGAAVPELDGTCRLVPNTREGYRTAIEELAADHVGRENLGRTARAVAEARWLPEHTEQHFVAIYRRLLDGAA